MDSREGGFLGIITYQNCVNVYIIGVGFYPLIINMFSSTISFLKNSPQKLFLALGLALSVPFLASAHTRWFAEGEIEPFVATEPTGVYLFVIAIIALLIIGLATMFERVGWLKFSFMRPTAPHALERASSTFSMITGAFFMIAGSHEYLFSPNLSAEVGIPMYLCMAQFAIGLMLVLGVFARVAGLLLVVAWFLGIHYGGLEAMVEDIWVLSIAAFIVIMGNDYFSILSVRALKPFVKKLHAYALPVLRLGTGFTLLTLGFTEKILRPELGLNFLAQHDWNFMSSLGFSDYLFVLMAGSTEALLGILLILGVMTRLTALVIAIIFTIPLFILGPIELTGHLPHFIAVFIILLFGPGKHFRLLNRKYRK